MNLKADILSSKHFQFCLNMIYMVFKNTLLYLNDFVLLILIPVDESKVKVVHSQNLHRYERISL